MEEEMQKWKRKDLPAIRRSMANPGQGRTDNVLNDPMQSAAIGFELLICLLSCRRAGQTDHGPPRELQAEGNRTSHDPAAQLPNGPFADGPDAAAPAHRDPLPAVFTDAPAPSDPSPAAGPSPLCTDVPGPSPNPSPSRGARTLP